MKTTWKSVLSVLLAIALLLPLAPAARADDEVYATGVTLSCDKTSVTYDSESTTTVTLTANVTTEGGDYNCGYTWSSSGSSLSAAPDTTSDNYITLDVLSAGTTNVTVSVKTGETASISNTYAVTVTEADDTVYATGVTVTPASSGNVYYRSGSSKTVTLNASVTTGSTAAYGGTYAWSSTGDALQSASGSGDSVTLNVLKAGSSTVTVTVQNSKTGTSSASYTVTVLADSVATCTLTPATASVEVGKTVKLTGTAKYLSGDNATVTYSSSNTAIATVGTDGTVTGVKAGTATITATAGDNTTGVKTATATVTVSAAAVPSTSLSGTTAIGTNYKLDSFYTELYSKYKSVYGTAPADTLFVEFSGISTTYGTLKYNGTKVSNSDTGYTLGELRNMVVEPSAAGTFSFKCTVKEGSTAKVVGTLTLSITTPTTHIRVPVSSSGNYLFSGVSADTSGKTGVQLIRDAIGTFGSIKFGAISSSGSNTGTLYTSSSAGYNDRVGSGTIVEYAAIGDLFFTPNRSGTYSIAYTAYSGSKGSGTALCSGNLTIPVDGASLNVELTLDSVTAYTFSSAPRSGADSAAALLSSTINSAVGSSAWSGIKFDGAASATSSVGTLHQTSGLTRAISADTFISKTAISSLYFVPDRVGTYKITYGVYTASSDTVPLATGTLTINVSNIPTGSADITYATTVKGTVMLKESDFIEFYQRKNGSRYYLSSVVFDDYSGNGTFYHAGEKFIPYNSADYYCSTYTGTIPNNAHYLEKLSFTAPSSAGYSAVKFTCYGGTSASSTSSKTTGVLYIFYTAGDVPTITYDAYTTGSVTLVQDDFLTVYRAATKDSAAKPSFEIRLLNVPTSGTLYRYYSRTGRTALTSSNYSGYTFVINGAEAESVEKLTYVAANSASGADTVAYIAYSPNGSVLYSGMIRFKLAVDRTVNITNDGLGFQASDFYNAADTDPVVYVTFPKPSAGRMYAYAGNRYVAAKPETKFYVSSSTYGEYPISAALYAPRANVSGSVTLECIAYRKSGASYQEIMTVNILNKISSGNFGDVNGTTNTDWAANSVDFAYKLGLVNGTSLNPPTFSPKLTMRRCDLVLILYRMAGSPTPTGTMPYTDVETPGDSYTTEIYNSAVWAYHNGIMRNAMTGTLYNPKGALTRQDFAQILFNYTAAQGISTANTENISRYDDAAQVSAETLEGVTWAVANGYITSASTTALRIEPQRTATRAEIATLLHRYFTY